MDLRKMLPYDGRVSTSQSWQEMHEFMSDMTLAEQQAELTQTTEHNPDPSLLAKIANLPVMFDVSAEIDVSSSEPCNLEAVATRSRISERIGQRAVDGAGNFQAESYSIWAKNRDLVYDAGYLTAHLGDRDSYRVTFESRGGPRDKELGRKDVYFGAWVDDTYVVHKESKRLRRDRTRRELVNGYGNENGLDEAPFHIGMKFFPGILLDTPIYIPLLKSIKNSNGCHIVFPNGDEINDENWDRQEIYTQARRLVDYREPMSSHDVMESIDAIVGALDFDNAMKAKADVIRSILFPTVSGPDAKTAIETVLEHIHPEGLRNKTIKPGEVLKSIHGIKNPNSLRREVLAVQLTQGEPKGNHFSGVHSLRYSIYGLHDPREYKGEYAETTKQLKYVIDVDELSRVTIQRPIVEVDGADFEVVSTEEEQQVAIILEAMLIPPHIPGLSKHEKPSPLEFKEELKELKTPPTQKTQKTNLNSAGPDDNRRDANSLASVNYFTAKSASPSTGERRVAPVSSAGSDNYVRRISDPNHKDFYSKEQTTRRLDLIKRMAAESTTESQMAMRVATIKRLAAKSTIEYRAECALRDLQKAKGN